jgi:hypothetical protein
VRAQLEAAMMQYDIGGDSETELDGRRQVEAAAPGLLERFQHGNAADVLDLPCGR